MKTTPDISLPLVRHIGNPHEYDGDDIEEVDDAHDDWLDSLMTIEVLTVETIGNYKVIVRSEQ